VEKSHTIELSKLPGGTKVIPLDDNAATRKTAPAPTANPQITVYEDGAPATAIDLRKWIF